MSDREEIKQTFIRDTTDHSMEILQDDGVYRHLKFSDNGSQIYRFDLHTWPGALCIDGDMGTYVFSRIHDMFEFFIMGDNDYNKRYIINPSYWAEKLQAVDGRRNAGFEEFSQETFEENVKSEFDQFKEQFDIDDENEEDEQITEMIDELWSAIEDEVLSVSHDGDVRAYDAAMNFEWKSEDGEHKFDMSEFWDYSCNEYTHHYIWILYAIVWGIEEYNKVKTPLDRKTVGA